MERLLTRDEFREAVFARDNGLCVICKNPATAAHHIIERKLWEDGGYYLSNGASLCDDHHLEAEQTILACEDIRRFAGISEILLPPQFAPHNEYDKWGNIWVEEASTFIKGSLFESEQCQKVLASGGMLDSFSNWDDICALLKYPRTRHIVGSGLQKGDEADYADIDELQGKHLVIEEKIDGANTGISFQDCELKLQCRGHFLTGKGDWPEFDQFKVWATTWQNELFDLLEDRYILYGEWMSGFHSVYYDLLPHYFMEFDMFDKKERVFLDTPSRHNMLKDRGVKVSSVRVLTDDVFDSIDAITANVGLSAFISENAYSKLQQELEAKKVQGADNLLALNKDRIMEGLYVKWEENGIVKGRYKFVRGGFVQTILDSGEHWTERASIDNRMAEGCSMF